MGEKKGVLERLAQRADLGEEPLPRQPIVEIAGQKRVLIENHRGLVHYSGEKICANVCYGVVTVCGGELELAQMTDRKIVISGKIDSITLERGRDYK